MRRPQVRKGFVLMLDMLGFKERSKSDMFEMYNIWKELKDKIEYEKRLSEQGYDIRIQNLFMSDTFVLCLSLKRNDNCDFLGLMHAAVDLIQSFFLEYMEKHKVYFRGALSFGEFMFCQSESIIMGEALMEAYRLYESTNWIGVILTPSAEKVMLDCREETEVPYDLFDDFIPYNIPYKDPANIGGKYAINWISRYQYRMDKVIAMKRVKDAMPCLEILSSDIRFKYENTLCFVEAAIEYNTFNDIEL